MDPQTSEIVVYWQALIGTLHQRRLLQERPRRGGTVIPEADAYLFTDRAVFVLDMQRLGGIPREAWLDGRLWEQWRAALQGRRVFVSDGGGLAVCVARRPGQQAKHLPAVIYLAPDQLPSKPYHVTLGHTKRGPVILDLAGDHRAILVGGTSGSGKTNMMQSVILQLAAQPAPEEAQIAIVDLKEVDFSGEYDRLPHLFCPIARTVEDAARLIEGVEVERLRRQGVMARANVADWRDYAGDGGALPLLLLVVDEAADLTRTPAMETLITLARKGRAMGVSLIVGTQSPTSKVVDHQVRANLPTAIAFQTRTHLESQVILGCKGAEDLDRPGLALAFLGGRWERIQTLRVDGSAASAIAQRVAAPPPPALEDLEADLVRYAMKHLDAAFVIGKLYAHFAGRISKYRLERLAQQWEARGWLTTPEHATDARRVTAELLALLSPSPALDAQDRDSMIGVKGRDRESGNVTGTKTGAVIGGDQGSQVMTGGDTLEVPPFLRPRAVTG